MSDHPAVYYLSQAMELHDTPSALEGSLGIEATDRNWLRNLFLASQDARQALDTPMSVDKLFIVAQGSLPAELAGTFLVSGPPGHRVFLCTPGFGLEPFDHRELALKKLLERLSLAPQRDELLRFVALRIRTAIRFDPPPTLVSEPILGVVLIDRRQSIETYLNYSLKHLQDELLRLPALKTLLDQLLESQLGRHFPQVSLTALRVISYAIPGADEGTARLPLQQLSTRLLSETLLEHYNRGAWPEGQSREFVAPGYSSSARDTPVWEKTLASLSEQLYNHLESTLQDFWKEPLDNGQPRQDLFIDAMGTRFRAELLQQEQDWNTLRPEDYYSLCGLYPPDASRLHDLTLYTLSVKTSGLSGVLANAFVVRSDRQQHPVFFFYAAGRLLAFESESSLLASVKTRLQDPDHDNDLRHGLSLRERADLKDSQTLDIALTTSDPGVFKALFNSVVAKQLDNVAYVLTRYRNSNGTLALAAAFEQALDVRALIDPRLVALAPLGRWSHRLDLSPSEKVVTPGSRRTLTPTLATVRYQLKTLNELKERITKGLNKRPSLKGFIQSELSRELNLVHRDNLSPDNLYINHYASALPPLGDTTRMPNRSQSLVEHFLERLTQHTGALANTTHSGLFSKDIEGNWARVSDLDITQLNTIVERALPDFLEHYLRQQRSVYSELSEHLSEAVTSGLRREAQFKVLQNTLSETDLELLDNLLDSHRRDQRPGLHGFIPDAFELTLKTDGTAVPIKLRNCYLLTERGGLDNEHSGSVLLWTPVQGAETFHAFHAAEVELQRRLHDPVERLSLLENIARSEWPAHLPLPQPPHTHHRAYPALGFELIQNGFRGNRQNSLVDKAMGDLAHAAASPYSNEHFHRHLQSCLDAHSTVPILEKAIQAAENAALHLALPTWLAGASDNRQFALASLLDRYRQDAATTGDYHQDIPDIRDNARTKIRSLLSRDFPAAGLDPDQISISLTLRNAAEIIREPLTDFALRHFDDIDHSAIIVGTPTGRLPRELTGERLKTLVKEAAVGSHYANLLDSYLSARESGSAQRHRAFRKHCFWQSLLHAFTQVIRNTLSATAHGYIKHLLTMPDGLARKPLNGQSIDVRPLELISGIQAKADPVAGFYLIGPKPGERGPRILLSPQGPQPIFQEYINEGALRADLKNSASLQQRVLDRLAHGRRAHYAQQVFSAHRALLGISDNPLRGNFFQRLYQDTTALLKDMLGRQSMQDQHPVWSTALSWLKAGLEQGATSMLGRLRLPLLVWQTLPQLKDAAQKAWQGRWGEALEEFVISLAQLAVARRGWNQSSLTGPVQTETEDLIESPFADPAWGASRLTPGQKAAILGHEAHDVALADMTADLATGLYRDTATGKAFAAVGGKVFQVREDNRRWRIVKDQAVGPWLQQNPYKQWSFDLQGHCLEGLSQ
ncbi:dermonecrotic toxin domain-containing protein [Pseudomonas sp.]|uniref:dermonecrotic toxin domain-containing protein n=1 Tax=Pseudomonas sp. TaxID=306 RepID=UPI003F95A4DD